MVGTSNQSDPEMAIEWMRTGCSPILGNLHLLKRILRSLFLLSLMGVKGIVETGFKGFQRISKGPDGGEHH